MGEIEEKIYGFLGPLLDGSDVFVVNIKIKPINNVKVYLDADTGFSIEKSSAINRKLYQMIEASGMFPGDDFSLEVSSPGVDEPLQQMRQYQKNIGRKVLVTDHEGQEKTGKLVAVTDDGITLEMKIAKKKEVTLTELPFSQIKKTIVQITFS